MAKKRRPGRPKVEDKKLPYPIRLRESLLDQIKSHAANNNRSLNGEITNTLEDKYIK